jgi:hypothetical protein
MLSLGKLLNPDEFDKYIEETNSFETSVHKYGTKFDIPDYPCWMEYRDERMSGSSIAFTRNTIKNKVLREMSEKVAVIIDNITVDQFKPDPSRVHFIKTIGSILPHKDEANRMCCINIGVKNSNSAVTKISNINSHVDFYNNCTDYIIEDGFGFLVNTNNYHAVSGNKNTPRYLITYGFGNDFGDVKKIFK